MGVGYEVSPLHRISYSEPIPGAEPKKPPDFITEALRNMGGVWDGRPTRFVSPSVASILEWRERLNEKYRQPLGEDLNWDEESPFERGEDLATGADMLLHYVAAVLDQRGSKEARSLVGIKTRPPNSDLDTIFDEAERRGASGRFPHLLLGARYWLPFKRNLIIEEPSWTGNVERYGSLAHLSEEVKQVRNFIADADPDAVIRGSSDERLDYDVLAAAWQASDSVSRLCAVALDRHLPLWTTG